MIPNWKENKTNEDMERKEKESIWKYKNDEKLCILIFVFKLYNYMKIQSRYLYLLFFKRENEKLNNWENGVGDGKLNRNESAINICWTLITICSLSWMEAQREGEIL